MGCLAPITIKNRLSENKISIRQSLGFQTPNTIQVPCGKCINCIKMKQNAWELRITHELLLNSSNKNVFVTLTFNNFNLKNAENDPSLIMRRYFERYRKMVGKAPRHFFITELGEENDRLHLHGIIFNNSLKYNQLRKLWSYGFSYYKNTNISTAHYIVGYLLKNQKDGITTNFKPKIFTSPGLGRDYLKNLNVDTSTFHAGASPLRIHANSRYYQMPRYYYNKLYNEIQRLYFAREYQKLPFNRSLRRTMYTDPQLYESARSDYFVDTLRRHLSQELKPKL